MMVRLTLPVDGIKGHWDLEIPEGHDFIEWACKKRDESGLKGWGAIAAFEHAIRDCITDELSVDIIPNLFITSGGNGQNER